MLLEAGVNSLVDIRRYPGSRRNPQFNGPAIEAAVTDAGIGYRHAVELGGRRSGEPGEERFGCIRVGAFRSYAARMTTLAWQEALAAALLEPAPCFMCAETPWQKCHRRFVAELLWARGHEVIHLIAPGRSERHVPLDDSEAREGRLHLCGELVA
jgi:uncharacterized protein (DUF488 family)